MDDMTALDDDELDLVAALQHAPRAPLSLLAEVDTDRDAPGAPGDHRVDVTQAGRVPAVVLNGE